MAVSVRVTKQHPGETVSSAGLTLSQAARVEDFIRSNTLFGKIEAIRKAQQEATESYTSQVASIFRMPSCQAYM
jgi:hypothetical protein